jgi:hypothetical protein
MRMGADGALDLVRFGVGASGSVAVDDEIVAAEGLEGLLVARGCTSESRQQAWHDAYTATAGRAVVAIHELASALTVLQEGGFEVVLLPGAALLRFYPDAGCRPMDDIDLLCAPGQSTAVAQVLTSIGWATTPRYPDLLNGRHVCVDLHEDLFHCERIEGRRQAGWLDPRDVWSRRRRACVEGIEFWVLGAEDEVLYTAAHALRHSYRRLTWLVDLALQLFDDDLDVRVLRDRGDASGLARPVLFGLALLQAARVDLPVEALVWYRQCSPSAFELRLLRWMLDARQTTCVGEVLWYWTSPSPRSRMQLLLEFVFPRTEVLLQVFPRVPRSLAPIVYGLRCGQLIMRLIHELVTMVPGTVSRRAKRG